MPVDVVNILHSCLPLMGFLKDENAKLRTEVCAQGSG